MHALHHRPRPVPFRPSVKGLEEFMEQFPDSALIPDAKKTLDLVRAEAK
jgi:outer membrane protein assembly factor BamD (BamD/ComL family)